MAINGLESYGIDICKRRTPDLLYSWLPYGFGFGIDVFQSGYSGGELLPGTVYGPAHPSDEPYRRYEQIFGRVFV